MQLRDIHGLSDFGRYTTQTAGGLIPIVAGGILAPELMVPTFIASGQGQMREALENAGVTDKASLAKGTLTYGTLIGGLQVAVPWATLRGLTKPAAEAFAGTVAQISARVATGTAKMSLAQSLAMGLSTWAEIYGVSDMTGTPLDWDQIAERVPEAIASGLIAGTLFGGAGEAGKFPGGGYRLKGNEASPGA